MAYRRRLRAFYWLAALLLLPATNAMGAVVGYWKFDEAIGSQATAAGSILDSASNHHGTPFGTPNYVGAFTVSGPAGLLFDGVNDRVHIPDAMEFQLTASLTLEAVVQLNSLVPSGFNYNHFIFRGDDRGAKNPYWLGVRPSDGRLYFEFDAPDGTRTSLFSTSPAPLNRLMNVAATIDNATGQVTLYQDGIVVAQLSTTRRPLGPLDPASSPGIGFGDFQSGVFPPQGRMNGILAEVRISNTALTPSQFLMIPEPAALGLLLASTVFLMRRPRLRRRRHADAPADSF